MTITKEVAIKEGTATITMTANGETEEEAKRNMNVLIKEVQHLLAKERDDLVLKR